MSLDADIWSGIFNLPRPARPAGRGQIVGFRLCSLTENAKAGTLDLTSIGAGNYRWRPGVNHASCAHGGARRRALIKAGMPYRHPVPSRECACGLYATADPAALIRVLGPQHEGILCGVQAWGRIVVHDWGFRSEYARIIALTDELPSRVLRSTDGKVIEVRAKRGVEREVALYLASRYGVTLIDLTGMPAVMAAYGDFLEVNTQVQ